MSTDKPARKLITNPKEITVEISDDQSITGVYLARFIEASEKIRVELRAVTPAWAQEKLDQANNRNRRFSQRGQENIRHAIERDVWEINGEAIVFDQNDALINGQHRLKAIAASGITVPCLIVYGISKTAFQTFDQQKKRNPADILSIEKITNAASLAASLSWQRAYDLEMMTTQDARKVPNDEILELAARHPEMGASVSWGGNLCHRVKDSILSPAMVSFFHYNLCKVDKEEAEKFLEQVVEGVDVAKGSHVHLLRRRLQSFRDEKSGSEKIEIAALVIKTWNRTHNKEPNKEYLVWQTAEKFPEISGMPKGE